MGVISKKVLLSIGVVVGVILIYGIISVSTGNPIKRYNFEREVKEYISKTYPYLKWNNISIRYSFKEESFYALVKTVSDKGIDFMVEKDKGGQFEDYYASATWEAEIMKVCQKETGELFETPVSVFADIHDTGKGVIHNSKDIPPYSEVSKDMASKAQITFNGDFSENQLESIVKAAKWIVSKQYISNVSFISDEIFIDIPYQSLSTIHSEVSHMRG